MRWRAQSPEQACPYRAVRRSLEKDICPSINEERDIGCVGRLASAADAIDLIDCLTEFSTSWKTVLQVAAYGPRVDRRSNVSRPLPMLTITAFQIDCHRQVRRSDDSAQIFDG